MKTREDAAREVPTKLYELAGVMSTINFANQHPNEALKFLIRAFIAGCEHEAENYKKLVEWAKRLQANRTFSAVAEVELDQILEEIGDEK